MSGIRIASIITRICAANDKNTDHDLCVFPVPVKLCSNMPLLIPKCFLPAGAEIIIQTLAAYFTLAVPRRARSLGADDVLAVAAATGATGPLRGATAPLALRFLPSRKSRQKIRIGLATKTDE